MKEDTPHIQTNLSKSYGFDFKKAAERIKKAARIEPSRTLERPAMTMNAKTAVGNVRVWPIADGQQKSAIPRNPTVAFQALGHSRAPLGGNAADN